MKAIAEILDNPEFDLHKALEGHKAALLERRNRLNTLLKTIDKTIGHLKHKTMSAFEELYEGLPKEQAMDVTDERYLGSDGNADHDFAAFMRKAMTCFADRKTGINCN